MRSLGCSGAVSSPHPPSPPLRGSSSRLPALRCGEGKLGAPRWPVHPHPQLAELPLAEPYGGFQGTAAEIVRPLGHGEGCELGAGGDVSRGEAGRKLPLTRAPHILAAPSARPARARSAERRAQRRRGETWSAWHQGREGVRPFSATRPDPQSSRASPRDGRLPPRPAPSRTAVPPLVRGASRASGRSGPDPAPPQCSPGRPPQGPWPDPGGPGSARPASAARSGCRSCFRRPPNTDVSNSLNQLSPCPSQVPRVPSFGL